jgi:fucose 4-O-acetylase-like acetyltransferase
MSSGATGERDSSLDIARGLAIVLVVAGHSLRGLFSSGVADPRMLGWLDRWLYVTHLPVFAFAVGLLTPAAVTRAGARPYLTRRLGLLAYLYVVWTLVQGTVEVLTSRWKNVPITWIDVVSLWDPLGHLWFLPHLATVTIVLVAIAPWRPRPAAYVGAALVAVVTAIGWGTEPDIAGLDGMGLLAFYVGGAAVGHSRLRRLTAPAPTPALLGGGVAALAVVGLLAARLPVSPPTSPGVSTAASVAVGMLLAVASVVGAVALSTGLARLRGTGWVGYVGRQSLAVYLGHVAVAAGLRVLLLRLGVTSVWVHLVVATGLGVVAPLVLERVTRRVPYLFVPPWQVSRSPAGVAR